ncbi:MAG: cell division protein FtsW [Verrucomicrobia bacterium]|nr:MAG: cell division protein FtsW [Verrucomicrobiota bacterium]TAE86305.1 MAG: cell division protein FtsW [Verrucomicrobiota bacterium]TAF23704.1 MAG: cell division protein FtsW [Verrucomicrobiota bacterium]TAF40253.1 MAG: cell division protein FtsW [Verrucomicrobiota bacterium]
MQRSAAIILCTAVAALVGLGLVMLASTSAWVKNVEAPYYFLTRQAMMVGFGVMGAAILARVKPSWLRRLWPWVLAGACVLLALCFVPGVGVEIYGSKRWIKAPGLGTFQPSELAKIVGVISLAGWFARWQTETHTFFRGFLLPGILIGLPLGLIAIETDVGSALALAVTTGAIFFCVGTRLIYMVPVAIAAISGAAWFIHSNENRWSRIVAWMNLEDPVHQLGKGMQQWRALLAFGNGGPMGVGLGEGSEKFGTLTFAHIDFIFPVVGEELGLPYTLGTVLCYVIIAVCGSSIAIHAANLFDRVLAIGLTCVVVVPAMVNIAVTTAVLPNDGLPLPFVSFGGTSLVFSLGAIGLLCGIHRRSRPAEEYTLPAAATRSYAVKL